MNAYDLKTVFRTLITQGQIFSQKPVYEGYDKNVQGNTVHERGQAISAVTACFRDFPELEGQDVSKTSVTLSSGGNSNYAKIDPEYAASQAILESWWRVVLVGGSPLAATDCLNFGNPEKKESMGELVAGIGGVKRACETLRLPIVSGNVSLYNEYEGISIPPSAIVSCFGRIDDPEIVPQIAFIKPNQTLYATKIQSQNLGGSSFLAAFDKKDSSLPTLDFEKLQTLEGKIKSLLETNKMPQLNIIARGGLFAALIESSFENQIGIELEIPKNQSVPHFLFTEDLGFVFASDVSPAEIKHFFGDLVVPIGKTNQDFDFKIHHGAAVIYDENLEALKDLWDNKLRPIFS